MARTALSPRDTAAVLHANLCALRPLVPVTPPVAGLLPAPGEWALGIFASSDGVHLDYFRHCPADVGVAVAHLRHEPNVAARIPVLADL